MTVIVNGRPRVLTGKLRDDFSFDLSGDAWIDHRSRICEFAGGPVNLFDTEMGWQPYFTKTPDPVPGFLPGNASGLLEEGLS